MIRELYYGDNLEVMRERIPDEHVDLIYLDPPFNSDRDYNLLFKTPTGEPTNAQIVAFQDSWSWGEQAERELDDITKQPNTQVTSMITAMLGFLGRNDMTAYLVMMASRLLELRRVLKPTGSLYLHCDPTASHYLKILLDAVFGKENFRNEIIWKRKAGRGETNNKAIRFGVSHDVIFLYVASESASLARQYRPNNPDYITAKFTHIDDDGRCYRLDNITSPSYRPNLVYEYKGYQPPANGWAVSRERMKQMELEGRLFLPPDKSRRIQRKRFLDELEGETVDDLWDDIAPINSQAKERLGYPTQKPLALLERIISASCKDDGIVLDPFCGCGTAVHAAESLGRQWIGIDITHLAISLIEKRLQDAFPDLQCAVHGTPKDLESARDLARRNKYQFQWWACSLVNAQPFGGQKKGADGGIDGLIYFQDDSRGTPKKIIVSVKGGDNINVSMIRDLKGVLEREKAAIGLFVCLTNPTGPMKTEAAVAGFYESPDKRRFPKIQIFTIADLFFGAKPSYPDFTMGQATFKKAPVTQKRRDDKTLLDKIP